MSSNRPIRVTGKRRHAALEEAPVSIEEAASTAVEETKILEAPAPEVTAVVPSEEQAVVVEGAADGAEVTEGAIVEAAEGEIVEGEEFATEEVEELRYACEWEGCGETFARHGNLVRHEKVVHRGERPFPCDKCEKAFAYKADLVIHDRSHTGEKPFACTEEGCTKAYAYKSTLTVHMRSHTGERPFPCEECGKAFVRPSKLSRHVREVHGGDKPFICDVEGCNAAFVRRSKLVRHEHEVHSGVPQPLVEKKAFACDVVGCEASFARRAGLTKHSRTAHTVV